MKSESRQLAAIMERSEPEHFVPDLRDAYEPEEAAGHDLPWLPVEDMDDFDTWAERVLNAGGFGAVALDIDWGTAD